MARATTGSDNKSSDDDYIPDTRGWRPTYSNSKEDEEPKYVSKGKQNACYSVNLKSQNKVGALVDRGANGGIAGSNTSIILRSGKKIDLCGVNNHTIRNLKIGTAGAVVKTTKGEAILVMYQCALMPNTKTIHSSGQLELHGNTVQDKSPNLDMGHQSSQQ
jgi:predicted ATP-grasp superfamily ATP-dependent carboligase